MRRYYIYIMSSFERTLYVGVTGNLPRRVHEHKTKVVAGFSSSYNVVLLVYYEEYNDVSEAIAREKQIKRWSRAKKIKLIESLNPEWKDLTLGF